MDRDTTLNYKSTTLIWEELRCNIHIFKHFFVLAKKFTQKTKGAVKC